MGIWRIRCVVLCLSLGVTFVVGACGDDGGNGGGQVTTTVGAQGGTVELDNGVTIDVPAGALAEDTEIGAEYVEQLSELNVAALPAGFGDGTGSAIVLTPHGTTFDQPVTVTLPTTLSGDVVVARLASDTATTWEAYGGVTTQSDSLSFDVYSFSIYTPAAVAQGSCPCYNAADLDAWVAAHPVYRWNYLARPTTSTAYAWSMGDYMGARWFQRSGTDWYRCYTGNGPQLKWITKEQNDACYALSYARLGQHSTSSLEVGVGALGVPSGESVAVSVTVTPNVGSPTTEVLTLTSAQDLDFIDGVLFSRGDQVSATIQTQPTSVMCSVDAPAITLDTTNVAVPVTCGGSANACDDDLSGTWTVTGGDAPKDVVVTGTKAAFSFPVPGGQVQDGNVNADNSVNANLVTDSTYPAEASSVYACDPLGDETITLIFTLDTPITVTLTKK